MHFPISIEFALSSSCSLPSTPVVYFLRLRSGQLYIGSSTNLHQRLRDHANGKACRTTRLDSPAALLRVESVASFTDARRREAQLKSWSRAKKEALVRGDSPALRRLSQSREITSA
jgi:putative endonuclease